MRYIIFLIISIIITSCGQNNTKQKELALKQKELELKERELNMKAKDSASRSNTQATTSLKNSTPTLHPTIKSFWSDLKDAVMSGNKEAVAQMTSVPFKDPDAERNYPYNKIKPLTCKTVKEFLENYDKIFTPTIVKNIQNGKYRGYDKEAEETPPEYSDVIEKDEYMVEGGLYAKFSNGNTGYMALVFKKIKGNFILHHITRWGSA